MFVQISTAASRDIRPITMITTIAMITLTITITI